MFIDVQHLRLNLLRSLDRGATYDDCLLSQRVTVCVFCLTISTHDVAIYLYLSISFSIYIFMCVYMYVYKS